MLILGGLGEPVDRPKSCCCGLLTLPFPALHCLLQAAAKMRLAISYRIFSVFLRENDPALSASSIDLCSFPPPTSSHATPTELSARLSSMELRRARSNTSREIC